MPLNADEIITMVRAAFPEADIDLIDLAGDNDHWCLEITSEEFRGKTLVMQHKMVYDALQGLVGSTLHALQIKTKIP